MQDVGDNFSLSDENMKMFVIFLWLFRNQMAMKKYH